MVESAATVNSGDEGSLAVDVEIELPVLYYFPVLFVFELYCRVSNSDAQLSTHASFRNRASIGLDCCRLHRLGAQSQPSSHRAQRHQL